MLVVVVTTFKSLLVLDNPWDGPRIERTRVKYPTRVKYLLLRFRVSPPRVPFCVFGVGRLNPVSTLRGAPDTWRFVHGEVERTWRRPPVSTVPSLLPPLVSTGCRTRSEP